MALTTVENEWRFFANNVLPGVPENSVQHIEMRKAFFAGAYILYCQMREIGEPHITEEAALRHMVKLKDEFNQMAQEVANDEPRNR